MSFDKAFYLLDHRWIALAMVVLLVAAGEIGYRRGLFRRESKESVRSLMSGTGAAMLGLLGLLLGFTLAMAVSRWDERRDVIVDEANAIGTLWLRAGLLEAPLRNELRLASIENYLPAPLFLLLFTVASVSIGFLAWAFGAANQGGRAAIVALGLLIGAVLLLIMDINRPQRGRIEIGIESLQRVGESMTAVTYTLPSARDD